MFFEFQLFILPVTTPSPEFISFPPASVTDGPLRVPLLWNTENAFALSKPRRIPGFQDSRVGGGPRSILPEIQKRGAVADGQFVELGLETPFLLNLLDREASGILLCAKNAPAKIELKNSMGSLLFHFHYHFLAVGTDGPDELECALQVATHRAKYQALISNQTGKKTVTQFRRLQKIGKLSLWESDSPFDRFHQVRLHAMEVGLKLSGDTIYHFQGERPAASDEDFHFHLARLQFPYQGETIEVKAPYPGAMETRIKQVAEAK